MVTKSRTRLLEDYKINVFQGGSLYICFFHLSFNTQWNSLETITLLFSVISLIHVIIFIWNISDKVHRIKHESSQKLWSSRSDEYLDWSLGMLSSSLDSNSAEIHWKSTWSMFKYCLWLIWCIVEMVMEHICKLHDSRNKALSNFIFFCTKWDTCIFYVDKQSLVIVHSLVIVQCMR